MKKQFTFCCLIFLAGIALRASAQSTVSINTNRRGPLKTVSEARSLSATNTLMPLGLGMASVALVNNNTVQTVGAAMAVYGIIMGPSSGNFYAVDYPRGSIGMAVRLVGGYLMKNATSEIFGHRFANSLQFDNKDVSLTDTKILIGEGLVVGSMIYNFLTAKKSVEEYNNGKKRFSFNVTPSAVGKKVAPLLTARINF